jgi:hypothetical protein
MIIPVPYALYSLINRNEWPEMTEASVAAAMEPRFFERLGSKLASLTRRGSWRTTPRLIEILFVSILLLCAIVLFGSRSAITRYQHAVERIGREAEPTVLTAEKLTRTLADMDAEIADSALGNDASWPHYVADSNRISALLVRLSRDVGYSDTETAGLIDLVAQLRGYYQKIGGASVATAEITGTNEQLAMTTTLWASRLLRRDLIPRAQIIKARAGADLAEAYADYRNGSALALGLALLPLLLLLGALLFAQLLLTRRTRRLVNLPLGVTSLLLAGYVGWFAATAAGDRAAIMSAKEDFFDDLKVVSDTTIAAQLMKADESMWLFEYRHVPFEERRLRQHYAHAFMNSAEQLFDCAGPAAPSGKPPGIEYTAIDALAAVLARCEPLLQGGQARTGAVPAGFTGPLADELRRGTAGTDSRDASPAEDATARDAASSAISAFLSFLKIDRQVRLLALGGDRNQAVQLSIGHEADAGNGAFDALSTALGRLVDLDESGFKERIDAADRHIAAMSAGLGIILVLTVFSAMAGLWPRYREYL